MYLTSEANIYSFHFTTQPTKGRPFVTLSNRIPQRLQKRFFFFENTKHKCINPRRLVVYTKTAPFSARAHNRIGFRLQTGTPQKENRNVQNNGPRSDPHELTSKEYTQGVLVSAHTEKCARNLHTSPHKLSLSNSLPPVLNHSKPTMNDRDFCLLNTKKKNKKKKKERTHK